MQDIAYRYYPIQQLSTLSISEEKIYIMDNLLSTQMSEQYNLYHSLSSMLETDSSSTQPRFEIKNEASLIEEILGTAVPEDMLEFDIVVRMPPKKEWSARLRVKNVEKAAPHIIEPEDF